MDKKIEIYKKLIEKYKKCPDLFCKDFFNLKIKSNHLKPSNKKGKNNGNTS